MVSIIIGAAGLITGENAAAYYSSHSRMGRPLHNCHTGESRYPEGQTRPPTRTDTVCYGLLTSQDAVTAAAVEVVEVVTAEPGAGGSADGLLGKSSVIMGRSPGDEGRCLLSISITVSILHDCIRSLHALLVQLVIYGDAFFSSALFDCHQKDVGSPCFSDAFLNPLHQNRRSRATAIPSPTPIG